MSYNKYRENFILFLSSKLINTFLIIPTHAIPISHSIILAGSIRFINRTQNQKRVLESLGLHKMGQTVEHEDTPNILGMIRKVNHLVSVETK